MLNLPYSLKYSLAPLLVVIISTIFALTEPMSSDWLAYDRKQIINFELWRLITGHFLHTNFIHFMLNLAGLVLLWALHGHYYQAPRYLLILILLCIGTSGGLYLFSPQLHWYVGLSGVLHGLFIIGAYLDIKNKLKSGWIMLVAVWIKVLHEQFFGASEDIAQLIDANVAIDAHLFGTITGCLIILCYLYFNIQRKSYDHNK